MIKAFDRLRKIEKEHASKLEIALGFLLGITLAITGLLIMGMFN